MFEKGGITGGVFHAKGGRTVELGYHATHSNTQGYEKNKHEALCIEHKMDRETSLEEG